MWPQSQPSKQAEPGSQLLQPLPAPGSLEVFLEGGEDRGTRGEKGGELTGGRRGESSFHPSGEPKRPCSADISSRVGFMRPWQARSREGGDFVSVSA